MRVKVWSFLALLLAALALAPAMAHLLALPNKIDLPAPEYFQVQQMYRGWALLGIVVLAALVANLVLAIRLRTEPRPFRFAVAAFACALASLAVFFVFTFPANQATANWTVVPENWQALRRHWEYGHATSAFLSLAALITLILAVLAREE